MRSARSRPPRKLARVPLLAIAVVLAGFTFLPSSPASAHTDLRTSDPRAGVSLNRAPASVRLVFTQNVAPEFVRLSLTKGDGGSPRRLETRVSGARVVGSVPADLAREPVREAGRVHWRVDYRVVSADGHPVEGSLDFTTPNPGPSETSASPTETPREADEPNSTAGGPQGAGDSTSSEDSGGPVLSTLVIGAIVASAGLGVASWLSRARKRGED